MACSTLLAGDMGGTKTLLALYGIQDGRLKQLYQQRFMSSEWTSLEPMLKFFLNKRPSDIEAPEHGCIAVAGKVNKNITLIHTPLVHYDFRNLSKGGGRGKERGGGRKPLKTNQKMCHHHHSFQLNLG